MAERLTAPVLGYAYDPAVAAIRAVRGHPGAALIAEPLEAGIPLADAVIAPSQDFAVVISAGDRRARIIRWSGGQPPSTTVLDDAIDGPERLYLSPSGRAAVLSGRSGHLQVVTGLPDSPRLHPIPSDALGPIAVADSGAVAVAGGDGVRVFGPEHASYSLPISADVAALAFDLRSRDLLAITTSGDIYVAKNIEGGADIRYIAYTEAPLADPVAIRFSADASSAVIATKSGKLASIDLNTGRAAVASCQCAPAAIQPLASDGLFRVTDISSRPLFLLDTRRRQPRVWFVPATSEERAQ